MSGWIATSTRASISDDAIALPIVIVRMSVSTMLGTRGAHGFSVAAAARASLPLPMLTAINGPSSPASVPTGRLSSTPPSTCKVPS